MKIELHMIAWNEAEILPFVLDYYKSFCDKITVYDNYSDDLTPDIAAQYGEVKQFGTKGKLDDSEYLKIKNNAWKGSDADWVIPCDADELVVMSYLKTQLDLAAQNGYTIFDTRGWAIHSDQMVSDEGHGSILDIDNGVEDDAYAKKIIFNPKQISAMNYEPGAHRCFPTGIVKTAPVKPWVFHYRKMGGVERLIERYRQCKKRLSSFNLRHGHGVHYKYSERKIEQEYLAGLEKSVSFKTKFLHTL